MKRLILILIALSSNLTGYGALNAYFSFCTFDVPNQSPFVETYLNISGNSVAKAKNSQGLYQGVIEVQWVYKQGDKVVHFDKYNLLSPESESPDKIMPDFIDLQRVSLKSGEYQLDLKIQDKNASDQGFSASQKIIVDFPEDRINVSHIELLESYEGNASAGKFSKNGYSMIPHVTAFYPKEISSLKFYAEIYNTAKFLKTDFLVRSFISNNDNKVLLNEFASIKKYSPQDVCIILSEFPIENLPSGNYNLTVEVMSRDNKLLAFRQAFFQRSNTIVKSIQHSDFTAVNVNSTFVAEMNNADTLREYLSCLYPISSNLERQIAENQSSIGDVESMKQYFYSFWMKRNELDPELAWRNYKLEVIKVQNAYGSRNKRGHETDRGRVYLQYGAPNSVTRDDMDPNARPYEIWHYYRLNHQTNRKFVFYSQGNSSNDYRLLHSDAVGEMQDPAWELKLHNRSQQFGNDLDTENSIDIYGSRTKENFKDPK